MQALGGLAGGTDGGPGGRGGAGEIETGEAAEDQISPGGGGGGVGRIRINSGSSVSIQGLLSPASSTGASTTGPLRKQTP